MIITGLVVALAAQDVEDELVVVELIVVVVLGIAVVVMGDPLLSNRAARVANTRTIYVRAGATLKQESVLQTSLTNSRCSHTSRNREPDGIDLLL
jgi:hypothetical protein